MGTRRDLLREPVRRSADDDFRFVRRVGHRQSVPSELCTSPNASTAPATAASMSIIPNVRLRRVAQLSAQPPSSPLPEHPSRHWRRRLIRFETNPWVIDSTNCQVQGTRQTRPTDRLTNVSCD
jgi:hypothetical protein